MWGFVAHGIGCIVMTKFLYEVAMFANACFIRGGKNLKQYGQWAVVTGATDGIGKAIAAELVKKGLKVLLVSRSEAKLKEAAAELGGEGKVETLAIDYSDFNEEAKKKVKAKLDGKDVGVLVNNVGLSYDYAEFFHDLDAQRVDHLVKVNIESTNAMTYLVLPKMLFKGKGCIINMSSGYALWPAPLYAGYNACKAYISSFSESLSYEYESKGVDVQVQYPFFVTTKMSKIRKPSFTTPTAQGYAKASVKAMGYEKSISPYWVHYIMMGVLNHLPVAAVAAGALKMHLAIRKKALAKKAQEKKA